MMAKGPILPETPVLLLVLVVLEKRSCPASGMNKGRPFPKTSLEFYPDLSAIVQDDEGGGDSVTQPGVSMKPNLSRPRCKKSIFLKVLPVWTAIRRQDTYDWLFGV